LRVEDDWIENMRVDFYHMMTGCEMPRRQSVTGTTEDDDYHC